MPPEPLPTRRALREQRATGGEESAPPASPRPGRTRTRIAVAAGALGVATLAAVAIVLASQARSTPLVAPQAAIVSAPSATALPVPAQSAAPVAAVGCDDPAVSAALAQGSDADVIAAFGGASTFRELVASGAAPCVNLADPNRDWVVVNKQRPLTPIEWEPATVVAPEGMQRTVDGRLRPETAAALTALVAAAQEEGAGAIGLNSAFRSFDSQTRTYNGYVSSLGRAAADLQSARPGFSEHQTGLAADVAACDNGCGAIEDFGGTTEGAWVAANAWRFGFIVRYEDGHTSVSGYQAEPWHLRYVGPALAQAYHDGGFHTLEEFFGLPAAPDYAD